MLNPFVKSIARGLCDLELHRSPCLVLHHHCARRHLLAVANISDPQAHKVTPAQLAVDAQIEKSQLANPALDLEMDTKSPDCP